MGEQAGKCPRLASMLSLTWNPSLMKKTNGELDHRRHQLHFEHPVNSWSFVLQNNPETASGSFQVYQPINQSIMVKPRVRQSLDGLTRGHPAHKVTLRWWSNPHMWWSMSNPNAWSLKSCFLWIKLTNISYLHIQSIQSIQSKHHFLQSSHMM